LYLKLRYFLFLVVLVICLPIKNFAQSKNFDNKDVITSKDTTDSNADLFLNDSISVDTSDKNKNLIDSKVIYNAEDSIVLSNDSKKVYLYNKARIEYEDIILEADFIEYDQENNYVFARGVTDTLGNIEGKPVFKDKGDEFEAKTIKYNFQTKKGYIEDVVTEEQEGFLHSQQTMKLEDNSFLIKNGKYTTCDLEHPHFYLHMNQAKLVSNDKIIAGPSYLVMFDVPIKFIGVPFAFFPNQKNNSSGIIVPKYGEESKRGFFLKEGGYYFGINDKMDLAVTGEIFSKGSWGGEVKYNYIKRYKFRSVFNFSYAEFLSGEEGDDNYLKSKDLRIVWNHAQDAKANPSSKFSASVNYSTKSFDKLNSKTIDQRTTNTKSSSITYGKSWPGRPFHLNAKLNHSQNTISEQVNLTLPIITFNMDRQYPFRSKNSSGDTKWYEDIEVQYSSKLENKISTADSLLFNGTTFSDFENGFQHNIPLSTNIKILKQFNLSPKIEYSGVVYTEKTNFEYRNDSLNANGDTVYYLNQTLTDELNYAQVINPSISLGIGPNLYGMYQFKNPNSKVIALRHVITPSVGISYRPDMGSMVEKYYFADSISGQDISYYNTGVYSLPSTPGESGSISFGLNNNLEMKLRNDKDSSETTKKIKILESLSFNTSYNLFAEEFKWSPISIRGRTSLFDKQVSLNFGGTLDTYALDSAGTEINRSQWFTYPNKSFFGRLGRLERFDLSVSYKLNSKGASSDEGSDVNSRNNQFNASNGRNSEIQDLQNEQQLAMTYVDFDIPWNLNIDYKFVYSRPKYESTVTQTLGLSGDFSLTQNWKISFRANFDIEEKKLTTSSINIHRDLHCWEMSFRWIPIGTMQSYTFQINVKGSTLRDLLKWDKRKTWQDNL
jgi:lipopolysaccharide assembly outer membrane protein LptD (OstA)